MQIPRTRNNKQDGERIQHLSGDLFGGLTDLLLFKRATANCKVRRIVTGSICNINKSIFVCVEVLRLSQPNGVMSSAVSLPNHTFTGQA